MYINTIITKITPVGFIEDSNDHPVINENTLDNTIHPIHTIIEIPIVDKNELILLAP